MLVRGVVCGLSGKWRGVWFASGCVGTRCGCVFCEVRGVVCGLSGKRRGCVICGWVCWCEAWLCILSVVLSGKWRGVWSVSGLVVVDCEFPQCVSCKEWYVVWLWV